MVVHDIETVSDVNQPDLMVMHWVIMNAGHEGHLVIAIVLQ